MWLMSDHAIESGRALWNYRTNQSQASLGGFRHDAVLLGPLDELCASGVP